MAAHRSEWATLRGGGQKSFPPWSENQPSPFANRDLTVGQETVAGTAKKRRKFLMRFVRPARENI